MLTLLATLMAGAGLVLAALAAYVAWRRGTAHGLEPGGAARRRGVVGDRVRRGALRRRLAMVRSRWGDLKYVGIVTLAPAWLVFVLQYTGRGQLVTRRLVALLAIPPIAALARPRGAGHARPRALLPPRRPATHDLPDVQSGPVFWAIFAYNNLLLVGATVLFVASMVRLARTYRRMALVLLCSALLPWAANVLHNLEVGWFALIDLTPFAFTVTGGLLVWGLFEERLVDLAPLARSAVVESMADAVFVLDAFERVVDVNPAAVALAGRTRWAAHRKAGARPDGHLGDRRGRPGRARAGRRRRRPAEDLRRQPAAAHRHRGPHGRGARRAPRGDRPGPRPAAPPAGPGRPLPGRRRPAGQHGADEAAGRPGVLARQPLRPGGRRRRDRRRLPRRVPAGRARRGPSCSATSAARAPRRPPSARRPATRCAPWPARPCRPRRRCARSTPCCRRRPSRNATARSCTGTCGHRTTTTSPTPRCASPSPSRATTGRWSCGRTARSRRSARSAPRSGSSTTPSCTTPRSSSRPARCCASSPTAWWRRVAAGTSSAPSGSAELLRAHGDLSADGMAGAVLDAVRAFHGEELGDDLAMLVVRYDGGVGTAPSATS